jgi:hypothetical protein
VRYDHAGDVGAVKELARENDPAQDRDMKRIRGQKRTKNQRRRDSARQRAHVTASRVWHEEMLQELDRCADRYQEHYRILWRELEQTPAGRAVLQEYGRPMVNLTEEQDRETLKRFERAWEKYKCK